MRKASNGQAAWWLAGAEDLTLSLPAHQDCIHRKYRLTCIQYEQLVARSEGRCENCQTSAASMRLGWRCVSGRLHIDHEHELGPWAVRGLLCRDCNNTIDQSFRRNQLVRYQANAFHLTLTSESGVSPAEPPVGVAVLDFAARPWERTPEGWMAKHIQAWQYPNPISWPELIYLSGPHNLAVSLETAF